MKNFLLSIVLCFSVLSAVQAQKYSFSANYLYLGSEENHGIGLQSKIHLKNQLYLVPEAGFYFDIYEKKSYSSISYTEQLNRFYIVNVNLAYRFQIADNFSFFPSIGVGFFDKYNQKHIDSEWTNPSSGPPYYAPVDIVLRDNYVSITGNLNLSFEYNITKSVFATAGVKYLYDVYTDSKDYFPLVNAGIGYNF
jgi:hypothetical protein